MTDQTYYIGHWDEVIVGNAEIHAAYECGAHTPEKLMALCPDLTPEEAITWIDQEEQWKQDEEVSQ